MSDDKTPVQHGVPDGGSPGAARSEVDAAVHGLFGRDSVYMILWVLQLAGAAAVTPMITRLLGLQQYGGVAAANAIMQVVFVIAGCGLQVAIQRRFAERGGAADADGLLTFSVFLAAGVTLVAVATSRVWGTVLGFSQDGSVLRLAVLWAGTSAVTACCLGLLRSQDRLLAFSSVSLAQSVLAEVTSLVLVLTVRHTAEMFVLGQLGAQVVAATLALGLTRPRLLRRGDGRLVRWGLTFALPLVPATLGGVLLNSTDSLMVQGFLGREAVARYAVAINIGSIPMMVLAALDAMWLPRIFAVENAEDRDSVLATSQDALFRLLGPVMLGLSLGAPLMLRLWAPSAFDPDSLLLLNSVAVVSAIPYTAALSSRRALLARSGTVAVAGGSLLAAAVNIGLGAALIPTVGLLGAAAAIFCAYTVQQLFQSRFARQARSGPRLRRGLVSALACGALALATAALPTTVAGLTARMLLAVLCLIWFGRVLFTIAPLRLKWGARRRTTFRLLSLLAALFGQRITEEGWQDGS